MTPSPDADQFHGLAKMCRRLAALSPDEITRTALLEMAEEYDRSARKLGNSDA